MTREEAIARIKNHKIRHKMNEPRAIYISEALDMAIEALEQEPCDYVATFKEHVLDAISRIGLFKTDTKEVQAVAECLRAVEALSPVAPQQKMPEEGKNSKETIKSIPYLMHKEMNIPLLECQKAYDVAIEYLRSQAKIRG